jgi:hypothetical protein
LPLPSVVLLHGHNNGIARQNNGEQQQYRAIYKRLPCQFKIKNELSRMNAMYNWRITNSQFAI